MNNRKRSILLLVALAAVAVLAAACAGQESPTPPAAEPAPAPESLAFVPQDNEIWTYTKVDPEKTTLVVSTTGGVSLIPFRDAFREQNPDIQMIVIDITGGDNTSIPVRDWIYNGLLPDVMFWAGDPFSKIDVSQYFQDVSDKAYLSAFNTESLNRVAMDGRIYMLPGASQVGSIVYNKTMFQQYGWEPPRTFDEFVDLCQQITADTGGAVQPWNPNAKYASELLVALEAFTYVDTLEGIDNRTWYYDFIAGEASFTPHMQPLYDAYQKLIDAGLIKKEHFTYSATARGNEFNEGKIAMLNTTSSSGFINDDFEVGFMAFPGKTEADAYLSEVLNCSVGIPLDPTRSDKEQEAAERMLEFFCSEEGQRLFLGDTYMFSNIQGVQSQAYEDLIDLRPYMDAGKLFTKVTFKSREMPGTYAPLNDLWLDMQEILAGAMTAQEAMERMDERTQQALSPDYQSDTTVIATVEEDFTILEVSNYFADMYREKAGAEIGLISNNNIYRGNVMRMFAGDLSKSDVTVLKPRSFANDTTLVKATMTGAQLLAALNHSPAFSDGENYVYACSGLKTTVAPWNEPGQKMLSVTLMDGTPIEEERLYTVGFWEGSVLDEYITEIVERYEGTFEQLLTEYLQADEDISPARDGRITLVWD